MLSSIDFQFVFLEFKKFAALIEMSKIFWMNCITTINNIT